MEARFNMVFMGEEGFDGKTEFPYSILDLACALQYMVENPDFFFPVEPHDSNFDSLMAPNNKRQKTE